MNNHGHAEESYQQRNARNYNYAEDKFEELCQKHGITYNRLGFDEKNGKVPNFFNLNPFIRHLPDYVINWNTNGKQETRVVSVKGTDSFKQEDYNRIDEMITSYGSDRAKLWFCFIKKGKVAWKLAEDVKTMYESPEAAATEASWDSDGKVYRVLPLFN